MITVVLVLVGSTLVGSRKPFCCRASSSWMAQIVVKLAEYNYYLCSLVKLIVKFRVI